MNRWPTVSNKTLRDGERIVHIALGIVLLAYVYGLGSDSTSFTLLVRVIAFPVLVGSGIAMWQWPRFRRWLNNRRASQRSRG